MWAGQNSPHFCTVEKLGPTEGPNISTVLVLNKNMVGHNEVTIIPMVLTFRCTHCTIIYLDCSSTYCTLYATCCVLVFLVMRQLPLSSPLEKVSLQSKQETLWFPVTLLSAKDKTAFFAKVTKQIFVPRSEHSKAMELCLMELAEFLRTGRKFFISWDVRLLLNMLSLPKYQLPKSTRERI